MILREITTVDCDTFGTHKYTARGKCSEIALKVVRIVTIML